MVNEDGSPLGILLIRGKAKITIDMTRVDDIGVIDEIVTHRGPTSRLSCVTTCCPRFNNDDLFGADRTNGIYQVLETNDGRSVANRATSMQPGLPATNLWLVEHVEHDHRVILEVCSNDFPEGNIFRLGYSEWVGRTAFYIIV